VAGLRADPRTYQPGTAGVERQTFQSVGVRLKGRASFRTIDERAALKVKLDEFVPHQRLLGLRRLTINNMVQDPSWARERLAYLLYRESGVPASRCASARLTVNGEKWGVYANVETLDDELVESRFGKPIGNLYDTSKVLVDLAPANAAFFERETKGEPADGSDLPRLLQVMAGPEPTFFEDDAQVIDVDQFLAVAAVQAMTAAWDGFFAAANNYEVYRDPGRGRFVVLPWERTRRSASGTTRCSRPTIRSISRSPLACTPCSSTAACASARCAIRYLDAVERVLPVWDRLGLVAELDAIERQLEPFATEGRDPPDAAERRRWIDQLRKFLSERAPAVRKDLTRMRAALPP
jgi:hypothetical protein